MDDTELADDNNTLISYRVGRIEKTLEGMDKKLDDMNVSVIVEKVQSLEKSRDRLVTAITGAYVVILGVIIERLLA